MGLNYDEMLEESTKLYEAPALTEYGTVEAITQQNKVGGGDDEYSDTTPLVGSISM